MKRSPLSGAALAALTERSDTNALVRFLAWNMPYHAEHHAHASIPFHALPRAHTVLAPYVRNQPRGYARVHRDLARGLG